MSARPRWQRKTAISRAASYLTAAKQRELFSVRLRIDAFFAHVDPWNLLARPVGAKNLRRLVDRWLTLERNGEAIAEDLEPRFVRPDFKRTRAQRVIQFIETFCVVPEGPDVGKPMMLDDFQKKFIFDVFDNPAGTKEAILSMAKKNGKTALIAALVLAFLVGPEARYANSQIVSGAMEKEQASIVFKYAVKIAEGSEVLRHLIHPVEYKKRLYGLALNTEFRALANVGKSTHGISPLVAILDEVGQVQGPTSDFCKAVVTAQGAYDEGLLFIISTQAADDGDWLSLRIDRALQSDDPRIVCHLYTADPDCDIKDRKAWAAANPGLGTIRSVKDMEKLADDAETLPSERASFRNLNLNLRTDSVIAGYLSREDFERNDRAPTPIDGRRIVGGLDLAKVRDLVAAEFIDLDDGSVNSFFWLPKEGLAAKGKEDHQDYEAWEKAGYLSTIPGRTIKLEVIAQFLRGVFDRADVVAIGYDPWRWDELKEWLEKENFTEEELEKFVPVPQGFKTMGVALDRMERSFVDGALRHGNNPVLKWCATNAMIVKDPAGNRKFDKSRARGRIDGMVALAIASFATPKEEEDEGVQFFFV